MTWQRERKWGQAWTILAVVALVGSVFGPSDDLGQVLLVIVAMVCLGIGAGHAYRALVKEADEKGWPKP